MNQSPKKNKYIIKNQKLCSIPFLAIQPSSNTPSAHGKQLCSQQRRRLHVQLGTYTGQISSKVEPQATGGILDAKFLYLGKRDPPGSQLPAFHCWAFTQELFNLVLFRKYQLNTRMGWARAWPRGEGQAVWRVCMLLMAVEASSCINVSWMCISNYAAWLVSQYFWHQPHKLFNCSPCLWRSCRGQGGFLRTETVLGRPWRTSPMFMLYWKTVQKGILHQKPQTMFDQSPAAGSQTH